MKKRHYPAVIASWLYGYNKEWLRPDVLAGLTTAAVVIPKAMAYATIAGLPVEVGLYTAFLPMVIYAVLGTSRPLSVSTTTTLAILAAAELGHVVPSGDPSGLLRAAVTLTLLVGAMLVLASVLRLGFIANFISEPVLVGFKAGIGVVIVLDQVPKLLGTHIPHGGFLQNILATVQSVPHASLPTVSVGVVMIVLLIGVERFMPSLPAPLIAVAAGIAAAWLLGLQSHGVALVGRIPQGLPSIVMPDLSLVKSLWLGALGIALMSFTETIAAGRAFAGRDEPNPRPNLELLATGLANVGGAFLGSMPAGGGTSQTAVNRLAGARSQVSELVTAGASLLTMLFLAPLLALMPMATLAAVVIVYSIGLIRPGEFKDILTVRRMEFIWALTAFGGVMLLGTLKGILVAIVVSMVALAYQAADPPVYVLGREAGTNIFRPLSDENPDDETYPGLLLLRVEGRIFFANAGHIGGKIRALVEEVNPKVVALHLRAVTDVEYTALKFLAEAERKQSELGVSLWLVGMNPAVQEVVERSSLGEVLKKRGGVFANLETAVEKYRVSFSKPS
jgi:sulfate permease, SulP family